jgi:hypothetical protein
VCVWGGGGATPTLNVNESRKIEGSQSRIATAFFTMKSEIFQVTPPYKNSLATSLLAPPPEIFYLRAWLVAVVPSRVTLNT